MDQGKYQKWVFTWNAQNEDEDSLISENELKALMTLFTDEFVFQKEFVTRYHWQGLFKTKIRIRKLTLLNQIKAAMPLSACELIKQLTISRMHGSWDESLKYATKKESRVTEPVYSGISVPYSASDLKLFDDKENHHSWQKDLISKIIDKHGIIKSASDRSILWITDINGGTGKSKLVKYLAYNHPEDICKFSFGSSSQLRSAVVTAGTRKVFFIDIPRTLGRDDSIDDLVSVLEDIKNGFVVSSMYGKYQSKMFDPPHVIVLSNLRCPTTLMSLDRWKVYDINYNKTLQKIN